MSTFQVAKINVSQDGSVIATAIVVKVRAKTCLLLACALQSAKQICDQLHENAAKSLIVPILTNHLQGSSSLQFSRRTVVVYTRVLMRSSQQGFLLRYLLLESKFIVLDNLQLLVNPERK